MTERQVREKLVSAAESWLGYSEKNGLFREIIDLYNTQKPLPRGYPVQYADEWCATYVTAVGIKAGLHDIIFGECSCGKMIDLYREKGQWVENDAYVPEMGDIIMYEWSDSGVGDCSSGADHVGIVTACDGSTITVIEGNKGEAVAYRTLKVNGRYIRGYCLPNYQKNASQEDELDMTKEELVSCAGTGDNPSGWAREHTEYCKQKGIFAGDGAGNYGWQQPITREAVATIVHRALEVAGLADSIPDA